MKKWVLILLMVGLVGTGVFWACRNKTSPERQRVIVVANLMSHPILDAVQQNLLEELKRQGIEDGRNAKVVVRNANGDMSVVPSIASEITGQEPDLIITITTPMSQAVKKVAKGPMVFGAVTDPVGAGLISSFDKGEEMITGTSDAVPYDEQLRLIRRVTPGVKRLGVLFNPGEAASQYAIQQLRKFAPELGFELVEGPANSTGEVYPVAQNLASKVDAILISTDNTVAAGIAAAVKVATERKIPLFACDSGSVEKGAVAAVSAGYARLGIDTAKLAVRMLNGERGIPAITAQGSEVYINKKAAQMMGVTISDDVVRNATKVYEEIKE